MRETEVDNGFQLSGLIYQAAGDVMPPHVAMGAVEKRQTEAGGARQ
jgi:hypothetical protein